jgi:hypothetical protein
MNFATDSFLAIKLIGAIIENKKLKCIENSNGYRLV